MNYSTLVRNEWAHNLCKKSCTNYVDNDIPFDCNRFGYVTSSRVYYVLCIEYRSITTLHHTHNEKIIIQVKNNPGLVYDIHRPSLRSISWWRKLPCWLYEKVCRKKYFLTPPQIIEVGSKFNLPSMMKRFWSHGCTDFPRWLIILVR